LVGFSLVGSVLTLIGIYGVLSLSVASRRREIAIRIAVGAERRKIRNLVFAEAFSLVTGGVFSGVAAALVLSRVLRSFLFHVEPADPATLIGVGVLFATVALLASWVPTHRAAKVDPVEVLRYE
jgi:putative ABC transport system permease protein